MRIVVGMSGGVDSSVAALLLKNMGHEVIGLFMHNWEDQDENGFCSAEEDYNDVKRVCDKIGIPYYSVNFAQEYLDRVFKHFLYEYEAGRTPNPDVLCNREIKFGPFAEYAFRMGADAIATGHYAAVAPVDGVQCLFRSQDEDKDQTYFLNQLSVGQLEKVMFPLGEYTKPQIRRIAEENGLATASKKDSTGICFIGERRFREFLGQYLPAKPGDIVDMDGTVIGKHFGLMYYTKGQRRGLDIGGKKGLSGRWFVLDKDLKNNRLIVSCGETDVLFSREIFCNQFNWIPAPPTMGVDGTYRCHVRLRHRQPLQAASLVIEKDGSVRITCDEPQRAVTEGQYAVVYQGKQCLGGGVCCRCC